MGRRVLWPVLAVVVAFASRARAEEAAGAGVAYRAVASCPDQAAVVAAIRARAPRLDLERGRPLRLSVEAAPAGFRGVVEVVAADGSVMRRAIEGRTCDGVVSAMAIVAALALDPPGAGEAATSVASSPAGVAGEPLAPAPPPPPWPDRPSEVVRSAPVVRQPLPPASPPPVSPTVARSPARATPRPFHLGAGLAAELTALLQGAAVVPVGFLEVTRDGPRVLAPTLRAGFAYAHEATTGPGGESATFTWLLGRADACPVRVRLVGPLDVRPCVGVDLGALEAHASGVAGTLSPTRLWADGTLEGRLAWRPTAWLSLELEAGVLVPLTRDTFAFEPRAPQLSLRSPALTGVGSLAGAVSFW